MNGISSGMCMLKMTRPTVVSMSLLVELLNLGVHDVLVVEVLGRGR